MCPANSRRIERAVDEIHREVDVDVLVENSLELSPFDQTACLQPLEIEKGDPMLCGCHVRRAYRSANLRKIVAGYLTFRCRAADFKDSAVSGAK